MNSIAVRQILECVQYKKGWTLHWCSRPSGVDLWWSFGAPDYTRRGQPVVAWSGRVWFIEDPVSEDNLIKTALAAALQCEEHECRESFTYKGVRLFDPHISVGRLMGAAQ